MLRVWTVSGEELAALPVEEQSDVRSLKQHLQRFHGLPRFRQRLLCNGSSLDDDARRYRRKERRGSTDRL